MDGFKQLCQKIDSLLRIADFDKVKELLMKEPYSLWDILSNINVGKSTLYSYVFIVSSILEKETAKKHDLASCYLAYIINSYNGAYGVGLYHLKKAIKLDPKNIEYKENLLYYHELPERLINKKEAIKVALEILEKKPESNAAQEILAVYGMKQ